MINTGQHKRKYSLAKWEVLCHPKSQGGVGIQNLDTQNKCLLSKWLFKFLNEDGMWQELLRKRYIKNKTNHWIRIFWKSLMNVKYSFLELGLFKIKDGSQTWFWSDTWLGNKPLKDKFPSLFNIVRRKDDSVAQVLGSTPFNISFRPNLVGANLLAWHRIIASVQDLNVVDQKDVFVWG